MGRILPLALLAAAVLCVVVVRQGSGRVELVRQVHMDKWERSLDSQQTATARALFPTAKDIGRDGVKLHAWVSSLITAAPAKSPAKSFQQPATVPVVSKAAPASHPAAVAPASHPAAVAARQSVLRQLPRPMQPMHFAPRQQQPAVQAVLRQVPRPMQPMHFAPRQQQAARHPVRLPARRSRISPGALGNLPGPALSGGSTVEAKAKTWMRKIEQLEMQKYRKQYHAEAHRTPWEGARHYGVAQEKEDASSFFNGLEQ